jgi:CRP/FNR family transcriptional regulator
MSTEVIAEITEFFQSYPEQCFSKGHGLLRPDDVPRSVYYIESGSISQYDIAPSGNEIVVGSYRAGDFMPIAQALSPSPVQFFFEVTEKSILRLAPIDEMADFIAHHPHISLYLLEKAYEDTECLLRRLSHQMGGTALSQILFEITDNARRFGVRQTNGDMKLSLNENEIAKRVGLSRETVNRTLKPLKQHGVIKSGASGIVICDLERIEDQLASSL